MILNFIKKINEKIIPKENLNNRKRGFIGLESQKLNYDFDAIKKTYSMKQKLKTRHFN